MSFASAVFIGAARASKSIRVGACGDDHRSVGVSFLHSLVMHDVLRVVLPRFKSVNKKALLGAGWNSGLTQRSSYRGP